jgi:hypothetical protein
VDGAGVLVLAACGSSSDPNATRSSEGSSAAADQLTVVALGDSWPEGAHCGFCKTFAGRYAESIEAAMGRPVELVERMGSSQPFFDEFDGGSESLLRALREDDAFREAVAAGDVIMIATGPNEIDAPSSRSPTVDVGSNSRVSRSSRDSGGRPSMRSSTRSQRSATASRPPFVS